MRQKHRKHFTITLLVSLTIHVLVLTVLFTTPSMDEIEEYKKIKVKLGGKGQSKGNSNLVSRAELYASYSPSAGTINQKQTNGNSTRNVKEVIGTVNKPQDQNKNIVVPETREKALNEDDSKQSSVDNKPRMAEVQNVAADAVKDVIPLAAPAAEKLSPEAQIENIEDENSTVIGNSVDKDADTLASYEQMLPLWLNKFKPTPTNDNGQKLTGRGDIFIKIDRNGKVLLSKVIKSTGSQALDKALMKMIADADPVLPVPVDYHSDKKTLSYKISFEF